MTTNVQTYTSGWAQIEAASDCLEFSVSLFPTVHGFPSSPHPRIQTEYE